MSLFKKKNQFAVWRPKKIKTYNTRNNENTNQPQNIFISNNSSFHSALFQLLSWFDCFFRKTRVKVVIVKAVGGRGAQNIWNSSNPTATLTLQ